MNNYMTQWMEYENYACDKYYHVVFEKEGSYVQKRISGILISLFGGNITLLSDEGMWIIKLKEVVFMRPAKPNMETLSEEYKNILNSIGYKDRAEEK